MGCVECGKRGAWGVLGGNANGNNDCGTPATRAWGVLGGNANGNNDCGTPATRVPWPDENKEGKTTSAPHERDSGDGATHSQCLRRIADSAFNCIINAVVVAAGERAASLVCAVDISVVAPFAAIIGGALCDRRHRDHDQHQHHPDWGERSTLGATWGGGTAAGEDGRRRSPRR